MSALFITNDNNGNGLFYFIFGEVFVYADLFYMFSCWNIYYLVIIVRLSFIV